MKTLRTTVTHLVGVDELELEVTYTVSPAYPATLIDPAEPSEIEITSVTYNGKPFTSLSDDEEEALYDYLYDELGEALLDYEADRADYLYDLRRDERDD